MGSVEASAQQRRCGGRGCETIQAIEQRGRGKFLEGDTGGAAGRPISSFPGEAAMDTESRWEAAAIGDTDGAGPSGADGGEDGDRADLRGGFPTHAVMDSGRRGARHRRWKQSEKQATGATTLSWMRTFKATLTTSRGSTLMELVKERISDRRVLKLIRQWLEAGVMEDGTVRETLAGTPQGGVISPLLANIYLNKLDRIWAARCSQLGVLVRYADDFVAMCRTESQAREALRRIGLVMNRLGLTLHPEKTRMVDLRRGKESFVFLGCTIRKKRSIQRNPRRHFMQRWPSPKATKKLRDRVRELTSERQSGKDVKQIIAKLTPVLRGWGNYFRTGNADREFNKMDELCGRRACAAGSTGGVGSGPTKRAAIYRRSATRDGFAQVDGHREIPGASHTQKIIVKPCAGKPHARFERGS